MSRGRKPKKNEPFQVDDTKSLFPEHEWDYVDRAVDRVKLAWGFHHMMNPDGRKMLLAFSGGKDSICLFFVCKRAAEELGLPMESMFHVQYNVTCVDPPPLVWFVREMKKEYPFIELKHPEKTMWKLIEENRVPPTRLARYCCARLKEASSAKGEYTLTGARRAESVKRSGRDSIEIRGKTKAEAVYLGDNVEDERDIRYCMQTESYICNPIIDWSDEDVWKFIKVKNLPYCKLYDQGYARLGCIGCPMGTTKQREEQFARFPKFADCYKRAFDKMLKTYPKDNPPEWKNADEVFNWWIYGDKTNKTPEQEETLF